MKPRPLATTAALALLLALPALGAAPDAVDGSDQASTRISSVAGSGSDGSPRRISLSIRDASIAEVFEMLSRHERVNILLGKGVSGSISVNLFDVTVPDAIHDVAEAAGYTVEQRDSGYVVLDRKDTGLDSAAGNTRVRAFKVQYSDPKLVGEMLAKHLSRYGKITPLPERRMLLVEDLPGFLERTAQLLREIDHAPRQIMVEAKILEITLDHGENFGIDWSRVFSASGSKFGTNGFASGNASQASTGFFFSVVNDNLQLYLSALDSQGRVRTLSTPRLLAVENQEATTKIGNNIGYSVTTTINNVTTQTIQFLETGVILRFLASVDEQGRVVMKIHPEVSSGTLQAGIPSKTSTEVTTQLVAEDGQAILIGGLLSSTVNRQANSVPVLGAMPVVGRLFSSSNDTEHRAETVILITPHLVDEGRSAVDAAVQEEIRQAGETGLQLSTRLGASGAADAAIGGD